MKEFFLRGLFPLEKLDVVNEEEIGFPKTPAELMRGPVLNGADQLVRELLRANERDSRVRLSGE